MKTQFGQYMNSRQKVGQSYDRLDLYNGDPYCWQDNLRNEI